MSKLGESKLPKRGMNGSLPEGDYFGKLISVSEPILTTSNYSCKDCKGRGCDTCDKTGKKLQEQRTWTFGVNDTEITERLSNSTWPGGRSKNGDFFAASKMYKWVKALTDISDRKEMDNLDIDELQGLNVKIRIENNDKGFPHIVQVRPATSDEVPTEETADDAEEPAEEEVPF